MQEVEVSNRVTESFLNSNSAEALEKLAHHAVLRIVSLKWKNNKIKLSLESLDRSSCVCDLLGKRKLGVNKKNHRFLK